jgi:hypothetical protein
MESVPLKIMQARTASTQLPAFEYGSGEEHRQTKEPLPGQYVKRVKMGANIRTRSG